MNAVTLHRLNYWAYKKKIPLISHIVNLLTLLIYNSRIGPSCQIGEGTKLAYKGIGVLIVRGAKIGKIALELDVRLYVNFHIRM